MDMGLVTDLANQINIDTIFFIIKLLLAATIILILKNFAQDLAAYCAFRSNKVLGLRTRVIIRDNERVVKGRIIKYSLRWIVIKNHKELVFIPMRNWKSEQWSIILDEKEQ